MKPSLQNLGCTVVFFFQHDNDPKHTSKITTAFPKKLKVKVEECQVSNIRQLHEVIMEEWKNISATTCAALVNSMPRRVQAVLDNNGAHTKFPQCFFIIFFKPFDPYYT